MAGGELHWRNTRWVAAAVLAVTVLIGVDAVDANAAVIDRAHYSGTDSYSYDDCGFQIDAQVTFSGVAALRVGKHDEASAFYLHDNYEYAEIDTNHETGQWFIVRGNGNVKETKATPLGGNLFEFDSIEAGQPFTIEDSAGNIVIRDRGSIRRRIVFDTGGDDQPGGQFVQDLGSTVHGPHPGFFADFCDIANSLIGTP